LQFQKSYNKTIGLLKPSLNLMSLVRGVDQNEDQEENERENDKNTTQDDFLSVDDIEKLINDSLQPDSTYKLKNSRSAEMYVSEFNKTPRSPPGSPRCWICSNMHEAPVTPIEEADLETLRASAPREFACDFVHSFKKSKFSRKPASASHLRKTSDELQEQYDVYLTQCVINPSIVHRFLLCSKENYP